MRYGGGHSKFAALASCAAALAWIAGRDHDRVAFAYASKRCEDLYLAPSGRAETLRALAETLPRGPREHDEDWETLLNRAAARLEAPALIVLISDWLDPFGADPDKETRAWERIGELSARGHSVVMLQLMHGDELDFPWRDDEVLRFVDPRDRQPQREGPGSQLRAGYLERLGAHLDALEARCEQHGVFRFLGRSDQALPPYLLAVLDALAQGVALADVAAVSRGGARP